MKLKTLIEKLSQYDKTLEVVVGDYFGNHTAKVFVKTSSDIEGQGTVNLYKANLEILETPVGDIVVGVKEKKSKFLVIDLTECAHVTVNDLSD